MTIEHIQDLIVNTVKANNDGRCYQSLKLQQFDEKGNPKQNVAHFIKTCNNAGIDDDDDNDHACPDIERLRL